MEKFTNRKDNRMKVICIEDRWNTNNPDLGKASNGITKGNHYDTLFVDKDHHNYNTHYLVKTDEGHIVYAAKFMFITLDEWRFDKINDILNEDNMCK